MDLAQLLAQLMGQRQENPELVGFLADPASRPDVQAAGSRVDQMRRRPGPARPAGLGDTSPRRYVMQTPTDPLPFPGVRQEPVPVTPIVRPENPNDPSTYANVGDFLRAGRGRRPLPDSMRRPERSVSAPAPSRGLPPPDAAAEQSMAELENRAWVEALARTQSNVSNEGFPMTPRQWGIPGLSAQAAQARRNEEYARRRRDEFYRRNPPNRASR